MSNEVKKDFLTVAEAAEELGLGKPNVYLLLRTGRLPGFKIGGNWRFSRKVLDRWSNRSADRITELEKSVDIYLVEDQESTHKYLGNQFRSWSKLAALRSREMPIQVNIHPIIKKNGWRVGAFEQEALDVFVKDHKLFDAVMLGDTWKVDWTESYRESSIRNQEVPKGLMTARWWPENLDPDKQRCLTVVDAGMQLAQQFRQVDKEIPIFVLSGFRAYTQMRIVRIAQKPEEWSKDREVLEEATGVYLQLKASAAEYNYSVIDKECRSQLTYSQVEDALNTAAYFKKQPGVVCLK